MKTTRRADARRPLSLLLASLSSVLVASAASAQQPPAPDAPCETNADCGSFEGCIDGFCTAIMPTDASCAEDADCPEPGSICLDALCWVPDAGGTGVDPQPAQVCEQDADCPEGELCFDGYCAGDAPPDAGDCAEDADCGEGEMCVACFCMPTEGTCRADSDCPEGQRCDLVSVGSAGGSPDGTDPGPVCEGSYGFCAIDYTQVTPDPRCDAFCELATSCGGDTTVSSEDSGSGESGGEATDTDQAQQPQTADAAECIGFCSYLLTDPDAAAEMEAFLTCVDANAVAGCDAIADACGGEAEALGEAARDVPAGAIGAADDGAGGATAGGAEAQSGSVGDLFGNAFGDDTANGAGDGADAGAGDGEAAADGAGTEDDTGCTIGHKPAPGVAGLFLLALAGLGLGRRRR